MNSASVSHLIRSVRNLRVSLGAAAALCIAVALPACMDVGGVDPGGTGSGGTPASSGGVGTGGATGSGGAVVPGTGGAVVPGTGGSVAQGTGGAGTGGVAPGGAGTGGAGTGGRVGTGGAGTGGASTGGRMGTGGAGTGGASTGGRVGTGGAGTGGRVGTGGAGTGGRVGTGGAGTGGSSGTSVGPSSTGCTTVGSSMTVNSTIVVGSGQTYDGMCRRFIAGSALGDGSQAEGQSPVFQVNGGTLINIVLGFPAADGVHTQGNATLRNITWEDIGEDALTIKGAGTVTLDGGSSQKGSDKTFQVNAASTFRISNFKATTAGKFIRQNGDTTFKVAVFIDHCDISNMSEAIFRTDSSSSTVSMTNTRYSNVGTPFIGVSSGNITQSNNVQY